jgi:hypothetical protein
LQIDNGNPMKALAFVAQQIVVRVKKNERAANATVGKSGPRRRDKWGLRVRPLRPTATPSLVAEKDTAAEP